MIQMRVRNNNRVHLATTHGLEVRQGFIAFLLRMHPAIEDETLLAALEVVAIRADLRAAGEINKLHSRGDRR